MTNETSKAIVSKLLRLSLYVGDGKGTTATLQLTRATAQDLADALNEYVGRRQYSIYRKDSTEIGGKIELIDTAARVRHGHALVHGAR